MQNRFQSLLRFSSIDGLLENIFKRGSQCSLLFLQARSYKYYIKMQNIPPWWNDKVTIDHFCPNQFFLCTQINRFSEFYRRRKSGDFSLLKETRTSLKWYVILVIRILILSCHSRTSVTDRVRRITGHGESAARPSPPRVLATRGNRGLSIQREVFSFSEWYRQRESSSAHAQMRPENKHFSVK